jgi:predicted peptidase
MKTCLALLFFLLIPCSFINFSYAELTLEEPVVIDTAQYTMYIPAGISDVKMYPLLILLSPKGDAQAMIETWIGVSEKYKWMIFASKEFRTGVDMGPVLERLMAEVAKLSTRFPIDQTRVMASGLAGGGMGAHALSFLYPKVIRAAVINSGMINDYFIRQKDMYPRNKLAVFLADPSGPRYTEMGRDRKFLEGLGWKTKWIEFKGGNTYVPASACIEAAAWLNNQLR